MKRCAICGTMTDDIIYIGQVRDCGARLVFGRCCKPEILRMFKTVKEASIAFAKTHTVICTRRRQVEMENIVVDLSDDEDVERDCKDRKLMN